MKMKKMLAGLLALGLAALLSAQELTFGIGARGSFGFGLGSTLPSDVYSSASVQPFKSFLAGGALVGRLGFTSVPGFFIQPEIGFSHNQVGWKVEDSTSLFGMSYEYDFEGNYGYNSIDIPIIVGYDLEVGIGMVVSTCLGLNLSIPVGSINSTSASGSVTVTYNGVSTSESYKPDSSASIDLKPGVIPGVVLGLGFGYDFDSHNRIMGDLRYLSDFVPLKGEYKIGGKTEDADILVRRGLSLGVSYIYRF